MRAVDGAEADYQNISEMRAVGGAEADYSSEEDEEDTSEGIANSDDENE